MDRQWLSSGAEPDSPGVPPCTSRSAKGAHPRVAPGFGAAADQGEFDGFRTHRRGAGAARTRRAVAPPPPEADRATTHPGAKSAWTRHCLLGALGTVLFVAAVTARATPDWVTVQRRPFKARYSAYARVVPVRLLRVRVSHAGVVDKLNAMPGDKVTAGQRLARLGGPTMRAALSQRESAVHEAEATLAAARKTLAVERQQRQSHLSTKQTVAQAEAAAEKAQAQVTSARSSLHALTATAELRAPTAGTVVALQVANDERVSAGQTVLTLQPAHGLWLEADYYGADTAAVHAGMHGHFEPADGSPPIPVTVRSVFASQQPDGGRTVSFMAIASKPDWVSGEAGTVTLKGPRRTAVAVPTRALIMDRGRWWVLVHTSKGDRRQPVTPGPSRGEDTLIADGLSAGTKVVVANAYLKFHRDVSHRYEPPD